MMPEEKEAKAPHPNNKDTKKKNTKRPTKSPANKSQPSYFHSLLNVMPDEIRLSVGHSDNGPPHCDRSDISGNK